MIFPKLGFTVVLTLLMRFATAVEVLDLGQVKWRVAELDGHIKVAAKSVPGGIYTDLMHAGVLDQGDFYYRFNDRNYSWVSFSNWSYTANFVLNASKTRFVVLECDGLDTVAEVFVNNHLVLKSNNMFRRHAIDIKDYLNEKQQEIRIDFESPVNYARKRYYSHANNSYPVPPECVVPQFQGACHANHIRKMQSSFSWDWGPSFPSMGIWRPLRLVSLDSAARIVYVKWEPTLNVDNRWVVRISAIFDVYNTDNELIRGELSIALDNNVRLQREVELQYLNNREASTSVELSFDWDEVELWWPNGHGKQQLYDLKVDFAQCKTNEVTSKSVSVAFRTVQLMEPLMGGGRGFWFRVNNKDIFAKGSNWIPTHVLPELTSESTITWLLVSAQKSHMNMLRVWGGGIYQSDHFYDLADRLGIMIWQDFMFACSMYPVDELENVEQEVKHQVRRLQHHASVVIWAANNENELALRQNWYGTDDNFDIYRADYVRLYVDTIGAVVATEDDLRPFVSSSPSNGPTETEASDWISSDPASHFFGDVHVFIYDKNPLNPSIYPIPRFASEFGFQSWASFSTLSEYALSSDLYYYSEFVDHRQRHPKGNLELLWLIQTNLDLNERELWFAFNNSFERLIYLGQLVQATSLKTEIEHYRRYMKNIDINSGRGYTMGAMYWNLNDIWPGVSWATIEYGGKWKMAQYMVERSFRPLLLSIVVIEDLFEVHLINELDHEQNGKGVLEVRRFRQPDKPSLRQPFDIDAFPAQSAGALLQLPLDALLKKAKCHSKGDDKNVRMGYCFFLVKFESEHEAISAEWLPPPKSILGLPRANVSVESVDLCDNGHNADKEHSENESFNDNKEYSEYVENGVCFVVNVHSDALALYVWLDAQDVAGHFETNAWPLMDAGARQVNFFARGEPIEKEELKKAIKITHYAHYQYHLEQLT